MTLPTSGTLTALQVATEFGIAVPFHLSDCYRGGVNVPIGTLAGVGSHQTAPMTPNAGPIQIPTSGTLELSHFYGTAEAANPVSSGSLHANNVANIATSSPKTAVALCGLRYDGQVFTQDKSGVVYHGNWYTPTTPASILQNFWFRTTVTAGTLTTGGFGVGTWQQLSPFSDWDVAASAHTTGVHDSDTQHAEGYIDISLTNGGAIIGTWTFICNSEIDSAD